MCHLHLDCRWTLFFVEFQIDLSGRRGCCMLPMLPNQVTVLSKHHNYICDFWMHNSQNCSKGKDYGLEQFWFFLVSLFFFVAVVLKSDSVQVTKGVFRCNLNLTSTMSPFKHQTCCHSAWTSHLALTVILFIHFARFNWWWYTFVNGCSSSRKTESRKSRSLKAVENDGIC